MRVLNEHAGPVRCLAYAPDGSALASGGADGTARVYPFAGPPERYAAGRVVELIAFGPRGTSLFAAGHRACLRFDRGGRQATAEVIGQPLALAVGRDGEPRLAVSDALGVRHWRPFVRGEVRRLAFKRVLRPVAAFNTTADLFAVADGGTVRIGDPGDEAKPLARAISGEVTALAFAAVPGDPHAVRLAIAFGWRASIWHLERHWQDDDDEDGFWVVVGEEAVGLPARGEVTAVALSPNGLLALASDGIVRLWDMTQRRPASEFPCHAGRINALALSPDGLTAASAGSDHRVVVWDLA